MALLGGGWVLFGHVAVPVGTILLLGVLGRWVVRNGKDITGIGGLLSLLVVLAVWQLQLLAVVVVPPDWTVPLVLDAEWAVLETLSFSEKFTGFLAAIVWFVFVSQYTNSDYHRRRWVKFVFVGQVSLLCLGFLFPPARELLITEFVHHERAFSYAALQRGPLHFFALLVNYTIVSAGTVVLVRFLLQTRRGAWPRIVLLIVGSSGVSILNTLSILGLVPLDGFNYGGYGALPFALVTTAAVVRFRLLDIVPVARNTLVESLDDPVVVVDDDDSVIDYNQRAAAMQPGLSDAEGKPLEAVWPALAEQVDLPIVDPGDTQIVLEVDGQQRHFSLLTSPVQNSAAGASLGYSLFLRDVTELENSRRRLGEQNQRLDQVAATISHDLRNPLNVARGYLEIVETDDEAARDEVEESLDRMEAIIDDVLTLAREGDSIDETEPVSLEALAREGWEHVATGGATLVVADDETFEGDPDRLLQLLENCFRNAHEHGGGNVTVTVGTASDCFYVEDDGPGIPEEHREKVSESGFTTNEDGTGFGLAIVSEIAGAHGWNVVVANGSSGGARFEFHGIDQPVTTT